MLIITKKKLKKVLLEQFAKEMDDAKKYKIHFLFDNQEDYSYFNPEQVILVYDEIE